MSNRSTHVAEMWTLFSTDHVYATSMGRSSSDAASYDLSRLKPESSWVLIQVELRLAEPILPASTST